MGWETEIPNVVAGQPIAASWGNAIRDSIVHTVTSVAALPSSGVADGDVAFVTGAVNRLHIRRSGRWWTSFWFRTGNKTLGTLGAPTTITAADAGLVELTYGYASIYWTAAPNLVLSSSRFETTLKQIQTVGWQQAAGAVNLASGTVTFEVYVEGFAT